MAVYCSESRSVVVRLLHGRNGNKIWLRHSIDRSYFLLGGECMFNRYLEPIRSYQRCLSSAEDRRLGHSISAARWRYMVKVTPPIDSSPRVCWHSFPPSLAVQKLHWPAGTLWYIAFCESGRFTLDRHEPGTSDVCWQCGLPWQRRDAAQYHEIPEMSPDGELESRTVVEIFQQN
jgi:hypothetical protein